MSKLDEWSRRNEAALAGGGAERIEAQHKAGKKTARERIFSLLDEAAFVEIDKFVERTFTTPGFEAKSEAGEGVVCGYGTVNQRPVFVFAQDYTVLSGSLSVAGAQKILKTIDMALQNGTPVIGVLDSDGARISEGVAAIDSYAAILKKLNDVSGVIPTLSIVAGNCIGTAAYLAATTDYCFMIDKMAVLALHGPQIYDSTPGLDLDVKTAFSAQANATITGIAQFACATEDECYGKVKLLLDFLPSNNLDDAPYALSTDDLNRQIAGVGEGFTYDPKALIASVADNGVVLEYQESYSPEIITAFGRLNGSTVGFLANGAKGDITGHAARKAARFISLMDAYNIPIVTFTNCGGTKIEYDAMLTANITRMVSAYAQAGVPMLNVITKKAVADGFAMMCPKSLGADIVYAWPEAEITALHPETGALMMFEDEVKAAADGIKGKEDAIQKYREEYANPWQAARQGVIDDVINPAQTRQMLIAALEMFLAKRIDKPTKKHNIMPL